MQQAAVMAGQANAEQQEKTEGREFDSRIQVMYTKRLPEPCALLGLRLQRG